MNIILTEVNAYAHFAQKVLEARLAGQHKFYLTGNSANEAAWALDELSPQIDTTQKTVVVVAGTLDEEQDLPGSAFEVVAGWLTDGPGKTLPANRLKVVANPAFTERLSPQFAPFAYLSEACKLREVPLYKHGKLDGIGSLVDLLKNFASEKDEG